MAQHPDLLYLGNMLDSSRPAVQYDHAVTQGEFLRSPSLIDAVVYRIQCIGESVGHVSQNTRLLHTHIPWRQIVGMRHRIVHDYVNVKPTIVWDVVSNELPKLIEQLAGFVPDNPPEDDSWHP